MSVCCRYPHVTPERWEVKNADLDILTSDIKQDHSIRVTQLLSTNCKTWGMMGNSWLSPDHRADCFDLTQYKSLMWLNFEVLICFSDPEVFSVNRIHIVFILINQNQI